MLTTSLTHLPISNPECQEGSFLLFEIKHRTEIMHWLYHAEWMKWIPGLGVNDLINKQLCELPPGHSYCRLALRSFRIENELVKSIKICTILAVNITMLPSRKWWYCQIYVSKIWKASISIKFFICLLQVKHTSQM